MDVLEVHDGQGRRGHLAGNRRIPIEAWIVGGLMALGPVLLVAGYLMR